MAIRFLLEAFEMNDLQQITQHLNKAIQALELALEEFSDDVVYVLEKREIENVLSRLSSLQRRLPFKTTD